MINTPPLKSLLGDSPWPNPWGNWFTQAWSILSAVSQSGTTAERPIKNLYIGQMYFDTTLTRPIWWTGTVWINASGTTV